MLNILRVSGRILFVLFLTSCVTTGKIDGLSEYQPPVLGLKLAVFAQQSEIEIRSENNEGAAWGAFAFGLVGAAVGYMYDVQRNSDKKIQQQQGVLKPILSGLSNFDFLQRYRDNINATIDNIEWIQIEKEISIDDISNNNLKVGDEVLVFEPRFVFTQNMDSVEITTKVSINRVVRYTTRGKKTYPKFTSAFSNHYKYISPIITSPVKTESDKEKLRSDVTKWYKQEIEMINKNKSSHWKRGRKVKIDERYKQKMKLANKRYSKEEKLRLMSEYWAADNSDRLKHILDQAIGDTKQMFLYDLADRSKMRDKEYLRSLKRFDRQNRIFVENSNRYILESLQHTLCSIPKNAPVSRCREEN